MRMKFFERTYLLTLILFLVFLNGGVFALALYTYDANLDAAEQVCRSEEYSIARAYEADFEESEGEGEQLLLATYGTFYKEKGIWLCFVRDGEAVYSTLPADLVRPEADQLTVKRVEGRRYVLISETICGGVYTLTYAKDVSYIDEEFKQLAVVFVGGSLVASTLLAVVLYLLLRRLNAPLQKLRTVTETIAQGDFSVRADERGNDEFSALAKDFNHMADQLCAHMEELRRTADQKQRMLDDLAHEMRTPLTSIHGYAEYIGAANISEEEKIDATQYIMSESMRLKSISETLLDTAFVRENKIMPVPLSARGLLERTREHFAERAAGHGVELAVCGGEDFELVGDEVLLELLLSNLTENALKACRKTSSRRGRVELGAVMQNGEKALLVRDNGIGMTEDQLAHVTEPFYRTDRSRSRSEGGTGLGLSLCARIVQAHGASLKFQSVPEKGTTVFAIFTTP